MSARMNELIRLASIYALAADEDIYDPELDDEFFDEEGFNPEEEWTPPVIPEESPPTAVQKPEAKLEPEEETAPEESPYPSDFADRLEGYSKAQAENRSEFWNADGQKLKEWSNGLDPEGLQKSLPGWKPNQVAMMVYVLTNTRPEKKKVKTPASYTKGPKGKTQLKLERLLGPTQDDTQEEQILKNLLREDPQAFFEDVQDIDPDGERKFDEEGEPIVIEQFKLFQKAPGFSNYMEIDGEPPDEQRRRELQGAGLPGIGIITRNLVKAQMAVQEAKFQEEIEKERKERGERAFREGRVYKRKEKDLPAPEKMPWQEMAEKGQEPPAEKEERIKEIDRTRKPAGAYAQIRWREGTGGEHSGWTTYLMNPDPEKLAKKQENFVPIDYMAKWLKIEPELLARPLSREGALLIGKKWSDDWEGPMLGLTQEPEEDYIDNNFRPFVIHTILSPQYQSDFDTASLAEQRKRLKQQKRFDQWGAGWDSLDPGEKNKLAELIKNPNVGVTTMMDDPQNLATMKPVTLNMIGQALDEAFGDVREAIRILRDRGGLSANEADLRRAKLTQREKKIQRAKDMADKAVEKRMKTPEQLDEEKLRAEFKRQEEEKTKEEQAKDRAKRLADAWKAAEEAKAKGESKAKLPKPNPEIGTRSLSTIMDDPHFRYLIASKMPQYKDMVRPQGGWAEPTGTIYPVGTIFGDRFMKEVASNMDEFKPWMTAGGAWSGKQIRGELARSHERDFVPPEGNLEDYQRQLKTRIDQAERMEERFNNEIRPQIDRWLQKQFKDGLTEKSLNSAQSAIIKLIHSKAKKTFGAKEWATAVARILDDPFIRNAAKDSTIVNSRDEFNSLMAQIREWAKNHYNQGWTPRKGGAAPFNEPPTLNELRDLIKAASALGEPWAKPLASSLRTIVNNEKRKAEIKPVEKASVTV